MPTFKVAQRDDLAPGSGKCLLVEGKQIALFRIDDEFHVIDNECPHEGASLGDGFLEGTVITCPLHAWQFDVITGEMPGHSRIKVGRHSVKVEGDDVFVELREDSPA